MGEVVSQCRAVLSEIERGWTLTETQVVAWADAHFDQTGDWPTATSGRVVAAPWETWAALNAALRNGSRGLAGGDSLPRLLRRSGRIGERRGRPPKRERQELACQLHDMGLSRAEIGRRLGVSRQAAWDLLSRVGRRTGSEPRSTAGKQPCLASRLHDLGLSRPEIGRWLARQGGWELLTNCG